MDISKYLHQSFVKYFDSLSVLGYRPESDVYALLIASFIEEILKGPMSVYITNDDLKALNLALACLYGTCLFGFPYKDSNDMWGVLKANPRISEDSILRYSENENLRYSS